jgi:hypothetical protein
MNLLLPQQRGSTLQLMPWMREVSNTATVLNLQLALAQTPHQQLDIIMVEVKAVISSTVSSPSALTLRNSGTDFLPENIVDITVRCEFYTSGIPGYKLQRFVSIFT